MSRLIEITLDNVQPTFNLPMILAIVWVIREDFAVYTISPVTVGQYAISTKSRRYQGDLIDEVMKRAQYPDVNIRYQVEGESYPKDTSEETMTSEELLERFYTTYSNREKSVWFLDSLEAYK